MFCGVCGGLIGSLSKYVKINLGTPARKEIKLIHEGCAQKVSEGYLNLLKERKAEREAAEAKAKEASEQKEQTPKAPSKQPV